VANLKDEVRSNDASVDLKLEVVVIPVSDVDRARLGLGPAPDRLRH